MARKVDIAALILIFIISVFIIIFRSLSLYCLMRNWGVGEETMDTRAMA
jgi:hypothetical protein